jgi:TetR/AcrR family transcriptional repressor of mexJK operon
MAAAVLGPRAAGKRKAIMDAAADVFLSNGYVGASMDEVAARAAVSKQTVYKHFASKVRLFSELVLSSVGQVDQLVREGAERLRESQNLEKDLTELARRFVGYLMQPDVIRLRRLVIAEADRFPDIGRTFYAGGPERVADVLAGVFTELAGRGKLRIDDATLAAYHFCWLVLSIPWNRVLFAGSAELPDDAEIDRVVAAGVKAFLDGYAAR